SIRALQAAVEGKLDKRQNGADIPNKAEFVHNIGVYPNIGGILHGSLDAEGYVKSGEGFDVVSSRDIWAGG
ncbi:hypothetical protein KKJ04_25915, partial [Xenorhabdus bovienii]|nr:hypothetical protein [Xenorhabdus bovienii]